ncbi:MAG: class I SAM-dependent methyltransferase [Pseudomonadota bacterium]
MAMLNSQRVWLERELTVFANSLPNGSIVLDAGSGRQQYKPLFTHCAYEATDFEKVDKQYEPSTYVCDLTNIPVEDNRFDAVVFTQVMEHLPEPEQALKELFRVTKPGGKMFYTGPLHYHEHEQPYDFYRYTQFGVRYLFEKAGWIVEDLRPLDGFLTTTANHLRFMSSRLPWKPSDYAPGMWGWVAMLLFVPFRFLARGMASVAAQAGARGRYTKKGYALNYLAHAIKPSS